MEVLCLSHFLVLEPEAVIHSCSWRKRRVQPLPFSIFWFSSYNQILCPSFASGSGYYIITFFISVFYNYFLQWKRIWVENNYKILHSFPIVRDGREALTRKETGKWAPFSRPSLTRRDERPGARETVHWRRDKWQRWTVEPRPVLSVHEGKDKWMMEAPKDREPDESSGIWRIFIILFFFYLNIGAIIRGFTFPFMFLLIIRLS